MAMKDPTISCNVTTETTQLGLIVDTFENISTFSGNLTLLPSDYQNDYTSEAWTYLLKTMSIFLIALGTIGNSISIIVLTRAEIGSMPTNLYLITLSIADLLFLGVAVLPNGLLKMFGIHMDTWHDVLCKLVSYAPAVLYGVSYWIQAIISIDRCIGIALPFQYRDIQRRHRLSVVIVIVLFFLVLESPVLFYWNIIGLICVADDVDYWNYFTIYLPWIDVAVNFTIPFLIMSICSVVMIRYLSASRRALGGIINDETKVTARKTTRLFVALNMVFIITNLPFRICYVLYHMGIYNMYVFDTTRALQISNHSVNFIVYILHVPKFRAILRRMCCCYSLEADDVVEMQNIRGQNMRVGRRITENVTSIIQGVRQKPEQISRPYYANCMGGTYVVNTSN